MKILNLEVALKSFMTSVLLHWKSELKGENFESDPDLTKVLYMSDPVLKEFVDRSALGLQALFLKFLEDRYNISK